jgi:hypothetical protein
VHSKKFKNFGVDTCPLQNGVHEVKFWSANSLTQKKWKAKENFEAYSQAQEIQAEVNKANDKFTANSKPLDILKTKLCVALNDTLGRYSMLFLLSIPNDLT